MNVLIKQPIISGMLASIGLLALYTIIMTLLSGWQAAIEQFQALWYLMIPLAVGFGIQVVLYTKLSVAIKTKAQASIKVSGVSSAGAMLACCVHHLADVAPFLGLGALSIFFTRYQVPLLTLGIGMNTIGIVIMLKHLKKISL
ncbi:hypothetical protein HY409_02580 [Candidatus Gottesmanbacteria bacterium]|nr:hypothetical protein [Candidatus Gottesmanbacteria bacterium]